jgi:hypothetical protein
MQRIGPENPGLSRVFAVRVLLLLTASFYAAGLLLVVLYALGADPLAEHPFG